jgi:hypothetical protein
MQRSFHQFPHFSPTPTSHYIYCCDLISSLYCMELLCCNQHFNDIINNAAPITIHKIVILPSSRCTINYPLLACIITQLISHHQHIMHESITHCSHSSAFHTHQHHYQMMYEGIESSTHIIQTFSNHSSIVFHSL